MPNSAPDPTPRGTWTALFQQTTDPVFLLNPRRRLVMSTVRLIVTGTPMRCTSTPREEITIILPIGLLPLACAEAWGRTPGCGGRSS